MAGQSNILSEMPVKENLILATFWIECLIVITAMKSPARQILIGGLKPGGPQSHGQLARKMKNTIVGGGEGYSLK